MKIILILAPLFTVGYILYQWNKTKDHKKGIIALATFVAIVSLAVMGNITRPVIPLYIAHIALILASWISLLVYLFKDKYYWMIIYSPAITIILFVVLEYLTGSGNENPPLF